jgi:hypothetical protein
VARAPEQTDEERVKAKLVKEILAADNRAELVAMVNAFTKLLAVEQKIEAGAWGEELPDEPPPLPEPKR